jgi:hypothetical protein
MSGCRDVMSGVLIERAGSWPRWRDCGDLAGLPGVSAVLRKLGEPTRSRAVAAALRLGLVAPR